MKNGFRQSMTWLHTWCGLLAGWVLYFVFLTGTAGYFDTEIDRWMQPERPLAVKAISASEATAQGLRFLQREAPSATQWLIYPPNGREHPDLRVYWYVDPADGARRMPPGGVTLESSTGEPAAYRETGGGYLLYRMHYRLHYMPNIAGRWIVGICSMAMLVGIVTGVIVHRRIFRDFFTFRAARGQRSWLDAHAMVAVLALPFHLMITYSGLVFIAYIYVLPVISASYGAGDANTRQFIREMLSEISRPTGRGAGVAAPLTELAPIVHAVEKRWGQGQVRFIEIRYPGDADARVVVKAGPETASRYHGTEIFDGVTGAFLSADPPRSAPKVAVDTMLALHEGLFAGPALRWLYFLSGVMGTAMVGTGLVLWTAKRRDKIGDRYGFRLVECLNVGTVVGLPIAVAAYFWANRLIPAAMADRAAWEAHVLFITWSVLLLHAALRPPRRAWIEQFWIAAAAYALLPVLNALTTDRHLGQTLPVGDWVLAGFDLTTLAFGLAFTAAAAVLNRAKQARPA